jgi:Tol biopolymer transport system component
MRQERWRRIEELYHAVLAQDPAGRALFLAEACAGDEELRREVESLLAQPPSTEPFLAEPAVAMAAELVSDPGVFVLTGRRIGAYQVQDLLGAGGMGEVYRARDTKLRRDVAIKILPRAFTSDPERLARFEREARMLAALNHPNIATIHGLEEADGVRALVLELVEGDTLADRVARGPIPVTDVLTIARQIADALDAAHEKGIVHRDLKPANVKITPHGLVKVLDFGLAKIAAGDASGPDLTQSPTVTVGGTREGLILGTAAYMSPEQARGRTVDKRTDIWAFGCVLYEMLTGRVVFAGETISDTIAAILEREPDWRNLPATLPRGVRRLIKRCLEKDSRRRLRDIGDARTDLDDALNTRRPSGAPARLAMGMIVLAVLLFAAGVGLFYSTKRTPAALPTEYIQLTDFTDAAMAPSLSPDGRMVTFKRGTNAAQAGAVEDFLGAGQIYVKVLPKGEAVQLTKGGASKYGPVFTPDGSRIAYTQLGPSGTSASWDTWIVPVLGGEPTRLMPNASGLTWIGNERILFSEITTGLHMGIVTATEARAESRPIYFPAVELGMAHYSYASPDLRWILIVEMANTHAFDSPCRLVPFDGSSTGRQVGPPGTCLSAGWSPDGKWMYFSADVGGHVHLWRQKFPDGSPEQMTFGTNQEQGIAMAPDGRSLITSVGKRLSAIWIHDAAGERAITAEGYASAPQLSADGKRVFYVESSSPAFSPAGPAPAGELRVVDLTSGRTDSVLPGVSVNDYDVSRDGRAVVFTTTDSSGESQIWLGSVDRRTSARPIARSADQPSLDASGDVVFRFKDKKQNFLYQMTKDGRAPERITSRPILIKFGVSPNGEWVTAAVSKALDENASSETVRVPTETVAIALRGGATTRICGAACKAMWSSDGRFFYVDLGGQTRVLPVPAGKSLPDLPASGISVNDKPDEARGSRVIPRGKVFPGHEPAVYAFQKTELHANLFRVPLQ